MNKGTLNIVFKLQGNLVIIFRYQIDVSFTECNIYHPKLFDSNVNSYMQRYFLAKPYLAARAG